MSEVESLWRELWPQVLGWGNQIVEMVRTLHPGFLVAFAVPMVLALLFRSFTALLLTLLLAVTALFAFRIGADDGFRWAMTALTVAAGLLAVALAAQVRRQHQKVRRIDERLVENRRELDEMRKKYEGEVYWRRAAERVANGAG